MNVGLSTRHININDKLDHDQTFITYELVDYMVTEYKDELLKRCKIIHYRYSSGVDRFWFTCDDLFSDSYILFKNRLKKKAICMYSLDHFFAMYFNFTKCICIDYLTRYIRSLKRYQDIKFYMYDESLSDEYDNILDTYSFANPIFDMSAYEDKLEVDRDKIILNLLISKRSTEYIGGKLKLNRNATRQAIFSFRKRMFKLLQSEGVIPDFLNYDDLKRKHSDAWESPHSYDELDKDIYLINEYPFEGSDYDKVSCIINNFDNLRFRDIFDIFYINHISLHSLEYRNIRASVMLALNKLKKEGKVNFIEGKVKFINNNKYK